METFNYFGYASNLDRSTLVGRLKTSPLSKGLGALVAYGFRFNFRNTDGSARANVMKSENESVYGVIFEIDKKDFDYLLTSEPGYEFVEMKVLTNQGEISAFTFISHQHTENIFPKKEYLDTILKGGIASGIPKGYLAGIMNRAGNLA
jgi:hypothetical protein